MPVENTLAVLKASSSPELLIDLRGNWKDSEPAEDWLVAVSKEHCPAPVTFITDEGAFQCPAPGLRTTASAPDREGLQWFPSHDVYTRSGLENVIAKENQGAIEELVAQLRSPMGVVPFVGAGISKPFDFPEWGEFLKSQAESHSDPEAVLKAIEDGKYEEAAESLWCGSPDRFQRQVSRTFGRVVGEADVRMGAVSVLPMLAAGPVITTNFNQVLETAFKAYGTPFERVVLGPQPDHVVRAMHRDERVLLKMHGDAQDRTLRTFTRDEYDRNYAGSGEVQPTLSTLAWVMFTNRPLLFLGCSLDRDRTLEVLQKIHASVPGITHYAILAAPYRPEKLRERRKTLDSAGVSPVWFLPRDFKEVERLLNQFVQEASTRLWASKQSGALYRLPLSLPQRNAQAFQECAETLTGEPCPVGQATMSRIAQKAINGGLVFFLGAYAHLGALPSARQLYKRLEQDFEIGTGEEKILERAEVAQYIADRVGRRELWETVKRGLSAGDVEPSIVYRILSTLPGALRKLDFPRDKCRLWFVTKNYDTMLERVLEEMKEPFHLLCYQSEGENEGRFFHRSPGGAIRVIDSPQNIRQFDPPAHVVVKLDGGIAWDDRLPECVSIAPSDFHATAGRIPSSLPVAVRDALRSRSLLVLGSSLEDAHIQKLIRWSGAGSGILRSWAVDLNPHPVKIQYWAAAGVEVLNCDLRIFVTALYRRILQELDLPPQS